MNKSATQQGVLEAKVKTDWEAIEKLYRAGVLSIREIARQHGITDKAIRNKAEAGQWQRDLTHKVEAKVRSVLVRSQVRSFSTADEVRTEQEIVESAAAVVVNVVRSHRSQISRGQALVQLLMQQLMQAADEREGLEDEIEVMTSEDTSGQRRAMLKRAVSLPVHAATVRDLSNAMKNLVGLERQAFNIADGSEPPPPDLPLVERVDEHFVALKSGFAKILGHVAAPE